MPRLPQNLPHLSIRGDQPPYLDPQLSHIVHHIIQPPKFRFPYSPRFFEIGIHNSSVYFYYAAAAVAAAAAAAAAVAVAVAVVVAADANRFISVGIATRYGLDGLGIESRWRRDFPHPSRPALGSTQPPIQWVPGLSWG